jgi:predicted O-linked N-acetylglucosamine transferase (SPINDLY family)
MSDDARATAQDVDSERSGGDRADRAFSRVSSVQSVESCDETHACRPESSGAGAPAVRAHLDVGARGGAVLKRRGGVVETIRSLMRVRRFADALELINRSQCSALGGEAGALALRGECYEGIGAAPDAFRAYDSSRGLDIGNPDAWCGLARLAHASGAYTDAVNCFRAARDAYARIGMTKEAEEAEKKLAAAWTDLGTTYKANGESKRAMETYAEIIAAVPHHAAAAYYNMGVSLVECGRLVEAESAYRSSIALDSSRAEAYCNIGVVFKMTNRIDDALDACEKCLRISPDFDLGKKNLSLVLTDQGTELKKKNLLADAIATYERALSYDTTNVEAYYNLGVACAEAEEYDRAIIAYENAGRLRPQCAEIWNNAGVLYKERGNDARAMDYYRRAVACNPNFAQPLNNLGVLHTMTGEAQQDLETLQRAVTVDPSYAVAHNNLGVLLRDTGDIEHACESYRECIRNSPNDRHAEQNYLLALNYVRQGEEPDVCEAHATWGTRFVKLAGPPLKARRAVRSDSGAGTPGRRKLVVGYVSPDMYTHSVSYFAAAPFRSHDKESVKLVVYNVSKFCDAQTERLRKFTLESGGEWRDCASLDERELAECIRGDCVDVLVELTGHTANNRLGTLALEPAPVQITWIGYPNSTGMRSIHYRITDKVCDPLDTKQTFTEQLVRIPSPHSFLCYTPNPEAPQQVSDAPCASQGFVTFGCFNTMAKVTADVRVAWSQILLATPGSRLYFKSKAFACEVIRQRFLSQMSALGVDNWRIDCVPLERETSSHLAMYDRVDIALDTFPYAGTTTTCESLHMGVPVLTLAGACHAHNVGKSLMTAVGLERFVAKDVIEYVRIASSYGNKMDEIRELRRGLREKLLRSPLCDAAGFTQSLEVIYRNLWQRWCDEKARESDDDEDERSDEDDDDNGQCGSVDDSKGDSNQDTAEQYEGDESAGEFSSKLIDTLEI